MALALARNDEKTQSGVMEKRSSDLELAALDAALAHDPIHIELRYCRAALLADLGRNEEAKHDYLTIIAAQPTHFGTLNDLATLLHKTDFRAAARLAYAEAVKHHPDNPIGRINLANALLAGDQLQEARHHFEIALQQSPDHPDAHQGLANLLQALGENEVAEAHRQRSYKGRSVTHLPYRGEGAPCRVLMLVSAVGGNIPTRFVLDERLFAVSIIVVEAFITDQPLPLHDVVFNAIGDADLCGAALEVAEQLLSLTSAPLINPPRRVRGSARAANAARLASLKNVVAPRTIITPREALESAAQTLGYPFLLRSPGFHTGRYFMKIDGRVDLSKAASDLPGKDLLAIQFLDARDAMGRARKYRVMMIGGRLYPLHLAISNDWKVHYFTADMAERPDHRAEEALFLVDMPTVLGPCAMSALHQICAVLKLDYAGIDFGVGTDGALLMFEANATMVVNPPGPEPIWDYRRPHVQRILEAAQDMIKQRRLQPRLGAS